MEKTAGTNDIYISDYLLLIIDQVCVTCVISPLVVLYWRGTWNLIGIYISPDDITTSAWVSFCIGNIGLTVLYFLKYQLMRLETDSKCSVKWIFGCHLFTYITGFICVNEWRGTWFLFNIYTDSSIQSCAIMWIIGIGLLMVLKASKNCWGPPSVIVIDTSPDVYVFSTIFNTTPGHPKAYILDTLLTSIVMQNLIVFFWRGGWGFFDAIHPDDKSESALASLVVTASITVFLIPVQILLLQYQKVFYERPFLRIFLDYFLYLFANMAAVGEWHGLWLLYNGFLLPDWPLISNWSTHFAGFVGTSVLLCSASLLVKSYIPDGSTLEQPSKIMIENSYIRYLVYNRKQSPNDQTSEMKQTPQPVDNELSYLFD